MVARPQVSDELVEFVQELHEDVTGSRAASFEQALRTFHRLHRASGGGAGGASLHDLVAGSNAPIGAGRRTAADPESQAVFKARFEDGTLRVPDEEVEALGLQSGQLLQVIAYPVSRGVGGGDPE